MTSNDFTQLSRLFEDSDPKNIMAKLNVMGREERIELAKLLFTLNKKIYGTDAVIDPVACLSNVLTPSV